MLIYPNRSRKHPFWLNKNFYLSRLGIISILLAELKGVLYLISEILTGPKSPVLTKGK